MGIVVLEEKKCYTLCRQDDGICWIDETVYSVITVILSLSSPLLDSPALCFSLLTPVALRTYTLRLLTNAYVFFPSSRGSLFL